MATPAQQVPTSAAASAVLTTFSGGGAGVHNMAAPASTNGLVDAASSLTGERKRTIPFAFESNDTDCTLEPSSGVGGNQKGYF